MTVTRTPLTTDLPVSLSEATDRARVSHGEEAAAIASLIRAAALEVEAAAGLAILPQLIMATFPAALRWHLALPVGPVMADTVTTVEVLAGGLVTALDGWLLEAGRPAILHLPDENEAVLRITYTAGLAATPGDVPADLKLAICDQVARLYDERGGVSDHGPSLSHHAARVIARYRRVGL